jgi:hypothetical protein
MAFVNERHPPYEINIANKLPVGPTLLSTI